MAERADIVIAGGGIAGPVAAAALSRIGLDIILVEPGQHAERRLAGELLHPLGVAGLAELDLLDAISARGAVAIDGFHLWEAAGGDVTLSYESGRSALAVDHAQLRNALLASAVSRPGVARRKGRVSAIENSRDGVRVRVKGEEGEEEIACRLLVGADGAQSRVRELAGIAARRHRVSSISAVTVPDSALPEKRYGQLFFGGSSATLAYRYGFGQARVMFDHVGTQPVRELLAGMTALPAALVAAIDEALGEDQRRQMNTFLVIVPRPRCGRVVLIGDAAGSCHPLTASGMSACIADALSLAKALAGQAHAMDAELDRHVARRRKAQLSRIALASAVHEVMASRAPEFAQIRSGMMRYWQSDAGRRRAVALLSMSESRPGQVFGAMMGAAYHGLLHGPKATPDLTPRVKLAGELTRLLLRYGLGLFGGPRLLPAPIDGGPAA